MKRTQLYHIIAIRFSICLLIILCNLLVSNYDISNEIYNLKPENLPHHQLDSSSSHFQNSVPFLDRFVSDLPQWKSQLFKISYFLSGSFVSWDAAYFVSISENLQYRMEHMHAFFPGMPLLVYLMRKLCFDWWLGGEYSYISSTICAVFISNASFVCASVALYYLTREVFGSSITQAKVLVPVQDDTSHQSDSSSSHQHLSSDKNTPLHQTRMQKYSVDSFCTLVCYLFALTPASVFCSVPYTEPLFSLFSFLGMYFWTKSRGNSFASAVCFGLATFVRGNGILLAGFFIYGVWKMKSHWWRFPIQVALTWAPYACVQYLAYRYYCTSDLNENLMNLNTESERELYLQQNHPWCLKAVPHLYSYAQDKYWNVGFFRYWTVSQIPNFLLAAPIICISLSGAYAYAKGRVCSFLFVRDLAGKGGAPSTSHLNWFQKSEEAAVYVYYLLFLVFYVCFGAHVQILTRFLVASPAIHWITSYLFLSCGKWRRFITSYHLIFIFVGCTLFSNFYPWT